MIYPSERYSSHKPHRQKNLLLVSIGFIMLAAVGVGIFLLLSNRVSETGGISPSAQSQSSVQKDLLTLWKERDYDRIIQQCQARLVEDPMHRNSLIFLGFASFYKGSTQMTQEDKNPFLDTAIQSLRKARLTGKPDYDAEIDYVLGKAYFQKGKYFADLSVEYIEKSVKKGYRREDSFEYLAIAYSQLGKYEKSVEYFEQAAVEKPSDLLFLTLSQAYLQLKKPEYAENYLRKAIEITEDFGLEEKCRSLLGELYMSRKDFARAEVEYGRIIEINSRSADAHFFLGEIFLHQGDAVKARSEWRAAFRINEKHVGARSRLFK